MTPAEFGDLADRLIPHAAGLACIVHGDGTSHDIAAVLNRLDDQERIALIVVLAGLINPDATIDQTFAYLTWDENGHALPAGPKRQSRAAVAPQTLRDIAVTPTVSSGLHQWFREEQRAEARVRYRGGEHQDDIARDLGVNVRTVWSWINAPKELAA